MSAPPPFHLAFPVREIETTRAFYVDVLGCRVGRSTERWIDFDFQGHQISAHVVPPEDGPAAFATPTNTVDGEEVPVRHFGLILEWGAWERLAERLRARQADFVIEPTVRFAGLPAEQATLFVRDPSGNALEFKSFRDPDAVFEA